MKANFSRFVLIPTLKAAGVVLAMLFLLGCQTLVSKEYPGVDWQYHIKTDNVGENRGIKWGYLFYKGRELKSYFNIVVIRETRYDFTIKTEESEAGGFWINAKHVTPLLSDDQRISKEEVKRGWYLASLNQRRADTPGDWIWVKRENIEAYMDPRRMYSLISKYKFSRILDGGENRSPFRVRMGFGFGRRL
jgi:hypothetical protein